MASPAPSERKEIISTLQTRIHESLAHLGLWPKPNSRCVVCTLFLRGDRQESQKKERKKNLSLGLHLVL